MAKSKIDIARVLANLPLFQQLSEGEIVNLAQGTREIRLQKGQMLFQKGDPAQGFYDVVYGQVKLAFPSPQGSEKVVDIIGPGQSFGEAVMFMEKPYPVFAQALMDAMVLYIAKAVIFTAIERDRVFARKMLAGLSMRLHSLIRDVEAYSLYSGAQRLIGFLLQQVEAVSSQPFELELPASKTIIASRLNLSPETLSRVLHHLSEAGLITVKGRHILIYDVERLRRFDQ